MRNHQAFIQFWIVSLFLLQLFLQPIHELSHHPVDEHSHTIICSNDCKHNGHISSENHCQLCDFTLSSGYQPIVQALENEPGLIILKPYILERKTLYFSNQVTTNKQLRSPPFIV